MSRGFEVTEEGDDYYVVELTGTPSSELAQKVIEYDAARIPIVISNRKKDEMGSFSPDQLVLITSDFTVNHHKDEIEGLTREGAIGKAKSMLV